MNLFESDTTNPDSCSNSKTHQAMQPANARYSDDVPMLPSTPSSSSPLSSLNSFSIEFNDSHRLLYARQSCIWSWTECYHLFLRNIYELKIRTSVSLQSWVCSEGYILYRLSLSCDDDIRIDFQQRLYDSPQLGSCFCPRTCHRQFLATPWVCADRGIDPRWPVLVMVAYRYHHTYRWQVCRLGRGDKGKQTAAWNIGQVGRMNVWAIIWVCKNVIFRPCVNLKSWDWKGRGPVLSLKHQPQTSAVAGQQTLSRKTKSDRLGPKASSKIK